MAERAQIRHASKRVKAPDAEDAAKTESSGRSYGGFEVEFEMANDDLERMRLLFVPGLVSAGFESAVLGRRLAEHGLDLDIFPHQARRESPESAAARLATLLEQNPDLHLIGHSMGGLIALAALNDAPRWGGRAVLLGPPLGGSAAARRVSQWPGGRRVFGAAAPWLAAPPPLRADPERVAVIAGTRDPGLGRFLGLAPGATDGLVHVDETRVPGVALAQFPVNHFGLLFDPRVAETAARFIRTGSVDEG